ncbi:MAG: recombinase family protein [Nocardioides sp.]
MNTSEKAPRALLYARISEDVSGEGAGVRRQLEASRDLASQRGWRVVEEVTDNDISALRGKHRPGYQRALELVRLGHVDYVVVWQTSRLLRNRRERADAIELFGSQHVGIISVKGQDLDLSNAYGRGMAGMLGEFDTMESEVKSERVSAAAADRARGGRPNGALGYGWATTGIGSSAVYAEESTEAEIVREITARLLAGESLLGVTNDLNRRGVAAPRSETWGKSSVKKVALRPANAGLRLHHRGRPTETLYEGSWPALVARDQWNQLRSLLTDPARRTNGVARPGARKHLLTSGIGACGVCGGVLRVGTKGNSRYGTKKHLYLCAESGCVGRDEGRVDDLVMEVVIARLAQDDALGWLLGDDEAAQRQAKLASALRRRLDDAADQYADAKIDSNQLERITARLRPQIEEAERARGHASRNLDIGLLRELAGPTARGRWDSITLAQRRAVLEVLRLRVHVDRVPRKGPGFDPESVRFDWKGQRS